MTKRRKSTPRAERYMSDEMFGELVEGVKQAAAYMRGEHVPGVRVTVADAPASPPSAPPPPTPASEGESTPTRPRRRRRRDGA